MAIEVTDVLQQNVVELTSEPSEAPESAPEPASVTEPEVAEAAPEAAPKRRGRPPGAKDKQPRRRVPRDEVEDIEEVPQSPKKKATRVQIAYESPESQDEITPPPTPRTAHRNQWRAYREQQVSHHQLRVAHYANIFDRMLA